MFNELCPECNHVLTWSTGKLRRRIFRRKLIQKVNFWYCSVGEGSNWAGPFCGCKNKAHKLHD
jgi:uncharacterized protein with PIN domain